MLCWRKQFRGNQTRLAQQTSRRSVRPASWICKSILCCRKAHCLISIDWPRRRRSAQHQFSHSCRAEGLREDDSTSLAFFFFFLVHSLTLTESHIGIQEAQAVVRRRSRRGRPPFLRVDPVTRVPHRRLSRMNEARRMKAAKRGRLPNHHLPPLLPPPLSPTPKENLIKPTYHRPQKRERERREHMKAKMERWGRGGGGEGGGSDD